MTKQETLSGIINYVTLINENSPLCAYLRLIGHTNTIQVEITDDYEKDNGATVLFERSVCMDKDTAELELGALNQEIINFYINFNKNKIQ